MRGAGLMGLDGSSSYTQGEKRIKTCRDACCAVCAIQMWMCVQEKEGCGRWGESGIKKEVQRLEVWAVYVRRGRVG